MNDGNVIDFMRVIGITTGDGGSDLEQALAAVEQAEDRERVAVARKAGVFQLMAGVDSITRERYVKKLAKLLGVGVKVIRKEIPPSRDDSPQSAGDLAEGEAFAASVGDDVLGKVAEVVHALGVEGEDHLIKMVYLAITSRLLPRPVSLAIQNVSASGKNWTLENVTKLFPDEAVIARTGLSEHALAYSDESFRHRTLIIYELGGVDTDMGNYLLRSLLSEGQLVYETVESTPQGLRSRVITKEGPTNVILTTTKTRLHPENETRLISCWTDDSEQQTARVLKRSAQGYGGADVSSWRAFQAWLAAQPAEVVVPYAVKLAELIPPVDVRLRRDFNNVLTLIKTHALICQKNRLRDGEGRIVATLEDYAAVRELYEPLLAATLGASAKATVVETVGVVRDLLEGGCDYVTYKQIEEKLGLGKGSVSYRVRECLSKGYLQDLTEGRQGRGKRLILGDPLPGEGSILPPREVIGATSPGEVFSFLDTPAQGPDLPLDTHLTSLNTFDDASKQFKGVQSVSKSENGHLPGVSKKLNGPGGGSAPHIHNGNSREKQVAALIVHTVGSVRWFRLKPEDRSFIVRVHMDGHVTLPETQELVLMAELGIPLGVVA